MTQYAYDGRDNLISLADAQGNTTTFAYDRSNRLAKETRPMGEETAYTYDAAAAFIPAGHVLHRHAADVRC